MMQSTSQAQANTAFDFIAPLIRGLATIFVTGLGMMLCANVGSLAYPVGGVGAVFGTIVGGLVFLLIGCCMSGFWRDFLPQNQSAGLSTMLPHALAVQLGGHGNFKLIITVHEAKNVRVTGRAVTSPNLYVEVECGSNPPKRTCVKQDGKFNEQFKLQITALDRSIFINLKDQEWFGSSHVGYVCVDVQNHILNPIDGSAPFPLQREFEIEAGEFDSIQWSNLKASIVLSFHRVPEDQGVVDDYQDPLRQSWRNDVENQWNENYGAVQFLSQLQFNPKMQIEKEARK